MKIPWNLICLPSGLYAPERQEQMQIIENRWEAHKNPLQFCKSMQKYRQNIFALNYSICVLSYCSAGKYFSILSEKCLLNLLWFLLTFITSISLVAQLNCFCILLSTTLTFTCLHIANMNRTKKYMRNKYNITKCFLCWYICQT